MDCVKVFIDTTILKFSVDELNRFSKTKKSVNWGGKEFVADVWVPVTIYPNEKIINNPRLKSEVKLLPDIAKLAFKGQIELMMQMEVLFESWKIPSHKINARRNIFSDNDGQRGTFYGAPITIVDAPIKYSRFITGMNYSSSRDYQVEFLKSITHERFEQLQKACGAYQGKNLPTSNELIDTFHIWCAENANADYFLTCDLKLISQVRRHKKFPPKLQLVKPSELLAEIRGQSWPEALRSGNERG